MIIWEVWLATCVASVVSDGYLGLNLFKEIANQGYKINGDKLKEVSSKLNPNTSRLDYAIKIVPGLNLLVAFQKGVAYGKSRQEIVDELVSEGAIVPMTDEEKEEYQKKPTFFKAVSINRKNEQNKSKETNAEMSRRVQVAVKKRYTPEEESNYEMTQRIQSIHKKRYTPVEKKPEYEVVHRIRISYNPPDSGKQKAQEEIPSVEEDFEPNLNARTALLAQKADLMIQKEEMGAAEEEEPVQSMRSSNK